MVLDQIIKILVKQYMEPYDPGAITVIDGFFQLYYIENRGMAFGATLGGGAAAKYVLSLFRLVAICGIGWYIKKLLADKTTPKGLLIAVALVFAGATGNLIDSMCYDFIWDMDPQLTFNWMENGNGGYIYDPETGRPELRPSGFLLGSVVDMFQFTTTWPSWMPTWNLTLPSWLGGAELLDIRPGKEIFGAIWNFADMSISVGVAWIIIKYRKFFRKKPANEPEETVKETTATEA